MAEPSNTVSMTRLYLGNLPRNITKQEVEEHFNSHGAGTIKEVKLMNGFGFIEYDDMQDARDVVPAFHGTELKGERLTVQFARGPRRKDDYGAPTERQAPRPRRTIYRMAITGLASDVSWQDLKDFARSTAQLDVVYSETGRGDGKGFVEFETATDLKNAVEKLDNREFKGSTVHCIADIQDERDVRNYRQRSPMGQRGAPYGPPRDYYDDRRGPPPRGYSPRTYRERSPGRPRPVYYDEYARRSPPREYSRDYPPPPQRREYSDPYQRAPPPVRPYEDPYSRPDPYARPRSPPPATRGYGGYPPPPTGAGYGGYDDRGRY